jgi:GNAT superfamily N-acetyltransferase
MATEPRACRAEELPALVDLANRVFRGERSGDMAAEYPLVFDAENLVGMRIIQGTSGPVAHVGVCIREARVLGARFRVASIGAVCTDPGHRGGGLASALMEDARRYALGHGASLMLISGGRGLYHRLGYVTIGRFHRYRLDAERLHGLRVPGVEVAGHRPEELPQIAALYQLEPIRFVRPAEDWERLLRAGMLMNAAADLLTVLQDGQLVAYVGVQRPSSDGRPEERVIRIQELAGARQAIVAALPSLLERYGASGISLTVQPTNQEFSFEARRHGWTAATAAFPGTVGVIDPAGLLEALQPLLAERGAADVRIEATEAGVRFALGGDSLEVGAPGPLAALLFGGETEEAQAAPRARGRLAERLDALLPLPLLWYGYNYV